MIGDGGQRRWRNRKYTGDRRFKARRLYIVAVEGGCVWGGDDEGECVKNDEVRASPPIKS